MTATPSPVAIHEGHLHGNFPAPSPKPLVHVTARPQALANDWRAVGPEGFAAWVDRYLAADPDRQSLMESAGRALAELRGDEVKRLIRTDPRRALEVALPVSVRNALPESVAIFMEEPISGTGDLALLCAYPEAGPAKGQVTMHRKAFLDGREFEAYVYGRRAHQTTLRQVPFHGIALSGLMAVDENPVRFLGAANVDSEIPGQGIRMCAGSGHAIDISSGTVALERGGVPMLACNHEHAMAFMTEQWDAEATAMANGGFAGGVSGYTLGSKRLLLIRVDFDDLPGDPFSDEDGATLVRDLDGYFSNASYGRTRIVDLGGGAGLTSLLTPTFRMPNNAAYYGTNNLTGLLRQDALNAATNAGIDLSEFEFDLVMMGPVPGFTWGGLGFVGSPGAWIRGAVTVPTVAHELGHNFGLNHANSWDTTDDSVVGAGASTEYGDNFDTMGSGGLRVFNARYKRLLGWLLSTEVQAATSNGTYRLFAHDITNQTGLVRGLYLQRSNGTNYWIEFRQDSLGNQWSLNGAQLRWAMNSNQKSLLLDPTPGTPFGNDDGVVLVGQTFSDPAFGIHITVLGKNGTDPESLDLVVNRGSYSGNLPPSLSINASAVEVPINEPVDFTATAVDPNDDTLAYHWDFGDFMFGPNNAVASHQWSAPGEYVVRCTVSDMKGGAHNRTLVIQVGAPSGFRISGRVLDQNGIPVSAVRVFTDTDAFTYTDSDGYYDLVGLPAGSYVVRAALYGYTITHPAFVNPVSVGPDATSVDFEAVPGPERLKVPLITRGSIWKYLDDGSDQGTDWVRGDFDDQAWAEGAAQLGYGDGDEVTTVSYGLDPDEKHITTYFRHTFMVSNPFDIAEINLSLQRDDGAVVYLNGVEIRRDNMPAGPVDYLTFASLTVGGAEEITFFGAGVLPFYLVEGANTLAVEIHQQDTDSADISFDLEMTAISRTNLARGVYLVSPGPAENLTGPTNLTLLANAWGGVQAAITNVTFHAGSTVLGQTKTLPFSLTWSNVDFGDYPITAIAHDAFGQVLTSETAVVSVGAVLIPKGAFWRYNDEGLDLGSRWTGLDYDDSEWFLGPAELGYGDGDEATVLEFGGNVNNKHITTYFRHAFVVDDPDAFALLMFRLLRDDGAVVHVNGLELFRQNMPLVDPILNQTLAASSAGPDEEILFYLTERPSPGLIRTGTNIVAVEVHQRSRTSGDLSFDLELVGHGPAAQRNPSLEIRFDSGFFVLTWPTNDPGWRVTTSESLSPVATWLTVPGGEGSIAGDEYEVYVIPEGFIRYYRLER